MPDRVNLDDINVHHIKTTVDHVRDEDDSLKDALDTAMDEAQGQVFSGESEVEYVVIEIRKAKP